jgi:protein-S-isoprenylcysteine O-methyltransferase Ste14
MVRQRSDELTWKDLVPSTVAGLLTISVIVLCALNYNIHDIDWLMYLGWVVWIAGFLLCVTPIHVLRRKGGVATGDSWVKTTTVVGSGPYAIVRHPIYVGWGVMMFALALISQYWVIAVCDAVAMLLIYFDIWREDRDNMEKFGEDYIRYQQKVPQADVVSGVVRMLIRKIRSK